MSQKLATVRMIIDSDLDEETKLKDLATTLKEDTVFDDLATAFPDEYPKLEAAWKSVLTDTVSIIKRPKAWRILLRHASKFGIDLL